MKTFFAIFITIFFVTFCAFNIANAGVWDKCKVCHSGKESQNPMMKNYKDDEELKEAAKDLGLK
jgi:hypothetical protein